MIFVSKTLHIKQRDPYLTWQLLKIGPGVNFFMHFLSTAEIISQV